MIIYNVTITIDADIDKEWLQWMKSVHIPEVISTECFVGSRMCKLLNTNDTGITYAIQYFCNSMEEYNKYQQKFAKELKEKHSKKYANKFAAFRTLLEVIE